MNMRHFTDVSRSAVLWLLAVMFVLPGCGPIQSTSKISEAEVALERARVADGDQKAPYEYYSAKFYLHKSKEEWGYSDFEASLDYATEAKRAAEAALMKAKEDPWGGSPVDKSLSNKAMKDTGTSEANPALAGSSSELGTPTPETPAPEGATPKGGQQ